MIWRIDAMSEVPVRMDFRGSGQDWFSATSIETGGIRIINAVELLEINPEATQVQVCTECGYPHCDSGNWVALRRSGDFVLWLPAWERMKGSSREASEFRPPRFLQTHGLPLFPAARWQRLRFLRDAFPAVDQLPWLTGQELVTTWQWLAPATLLGGSFSEPRIRRDLVLAISNGDLASALEDIDHCLFEHVQSRRPVLPLDASREDRPLELWLDLPGTPSWTGFEYLDGRVCFRGDNDIAFHV